MRIGILTFHCAHNYGAVLQAYALQQYLIGLGHNVDVVDYKPRWIVNDYKVINDWRRFVSKNPLKCVRKTVEAVKYTYLAPKRYMRFDKFINEHLHLSFPLLNNRIPENYDVYIVGSDQIWNPGITGGFDDNYFAYFPFSKGRKKYISYAASMETSCLTDEQKEYFRSRLSNLDYISVRENNLLNLIQPLTDKKVYLVLDPTLLVKQTVWNKFIHKNSFNKKYLLLYGTADNRIYAYARKLAQKLDLEILGLSFGITGRKFDYQTASPEQFISAFKYAEFVLTSSFHGTAFSIIFNKEFFTLRLGLGRDTRSESLLNTLGLSNRIVSFDSGIDLTGKIDWKATNKLLEIKRKESIDFINMSLL